MRQKLQVFSSNSVNKHGFRIAVSALEGGQWDNALTGVPAHVGHDVHKLKGRICENGASALPGKSYVKGWPLAGTDKAGG